MVHNLVSYTLPFVITVNGMHNMKFGHIYAPIYSLDESNANH